EYSSSVVRVWRLAACRSLTRNESTCLCESSHRQANHRTALSRPARNSPNHEKSALNTWRERSELSGGALVLGFGSRAVELSVLHADFLGSGSRRLRRNCRDVRLYSLVPLLLTLRQVWQDFARMNEHHSAG